MLKDLTMTTRLRLIGAILVAAGVAMAGAAFFYGTPQAMDGLDAAEAMYEEEGVKLNYNEGGQLVDRGKPEGAQAIMSLLVDEWKFPVNPAEFDPQDPVVNTRSELMYQYATITYHVLHTEQTVKLTEKDLEKGPITYRGVTYDKPGDYKITVEKYYAQLDRTNPIERQLRDAWSPLAIALTGSLAGAHANQAAGELALATTLGIGSIGLLFALSGGGLIWATFGSMALAPARARSEMDTPDAASVK